MEKLTLKKLEQLVKNARKKGLNDENVIFSRSKSGKLKPLAFFDFEETKVKKSKFEEFDRHINDFYNVFEYQEQYMEKEPLERNEELIRAIILDNYTD
jgi:hypothetical protein